MVQPTIQEKRKFTHRKISINVVHKQYSTSRALHKIFYKTVTISTGYMEINNEKRKKTTNKPSAQIKRMCNSNINLINAIDCVSDKLATIPGSFLKRFWLLNLLIQIFWSETVIFNGCELIFFRQFPTGINIYKTTFKLP